MVSPCNIVRVTHCSTSAWTTQPQSVCRTICNDINTAVTHLRSSAGPDGLIHRVEKFETKSIFLARPLDQLTGAQDDGSNPVAALHLLRFVEDQESWLENTPQFCPTFQRSTNFQPVSQHDNTLVLES